MKFLYCFTLIVLIYVAYTKAQETCRGRSVTQTCTGPREPGINTGGGCAERAQRMWFYNSQTRRCQRFFYRGCGGNTNRFCRRADCMTRCAPRPPTVTPATTTTPRPNPTPAVTPAPAG